MGALFLPDGTKLGRDAKNLTGKKFGKLTASHPVGKNKHRKVIWKCICDCGKQKEVDTRGLISGHTSSCGCATGSIISTKLTTHGMCYSPEYYSWGGMIARCFNSKLNKYKDYGGRGITVCERWRSSFENFLKDMGERPTGKSLDRINNDGNYEPSNCRWSTPMEQSRNKRNNQIIHFNGKSQCISDWAFELKMNVPVLAKRLRKWDLESAITRPVRGH